jgi:hypothetical protein
VTDRDHGLLGLLSSEVFDDSRTVTELLQMCMSLGTQTGSVNLRNWAAKELRGYEEKDKPPRFRQTLPTTVMALIEEDDSTGTQLIEMPLGFSETTHFGFLDSAWVNIAHIPIRDIERWAAQGSLKVAIFDETSAIKHLQTSLDRNGESERRVRKIYKKVSQQDLSRVVYQLRVSLAELLSEITMSTPDGQEMPTKDAVDRAMRVVVSGKGNTVTLINSQAYNGSSSIEVPTSSSPDSWWQRIRKRGLIVGLSTFLAAVAGIAVWFEWTPWK